MPTYNDSILSAEIESDDGHLDCLISAAARLLRGRVYLSKRCVKFRFQIVSSCVDCVRVAAVNTRIMCHVEHKYEASDLFAVLAQKFPFSMRFTKLRDGSPNRNDKWVGCARFTARFCLAVLWSESSDTCCGAAVQSLQSDDTLSLLSLNHPHLLIHSRQAFLFNPSETTLVTVLPTTHSHCTSHSAN